jgi:S1-C subfamily serine protease
MYTQEIEGQLVVGGLANGGPAERAGVRLGDQVLEVAGEPTVGLADLFRKVWRLGPAGTEVALTIGRRGSRIEARLRSADRSDFLLKPKMH